jgi:ribonuclease Z
VWGNDILLDCGEGTQMQMSRYGVRWRRLSHIFISHLHGDHYFGLPGLLNSMSLLGRTSPLTLWGPPALETVIDGIRAASGGWELSYPLEFHPLPEGAATLVDTPYFSVNCFPVEHRIACHGFLVERKTRGRKLLPDKAREAGIPAFFWDRLKNGKDYVHDDGRITPADSVTTDGPVPKRYAYCADTRYTLSFLEHIRDADLLYHESTFLEADAAKAAERYHSTARQAAEIAKAAGVKALLLGHYSSRYRDLEPFRAEAAEVFPHVQATIEGAAYEV